MKSYRSLAAKDSACRFYLVISISRIAAGAARAQAPSGAGRPGVVNPRGDTDIQTNREAMLRSTGAGTGAGQINQQRLTAAIEQTKQDFKRIQLVRNDMVDNLVAKKPLDYKLISEQAAEINKRSNRLKSFIIPTAPVDAKTNEGKKDELKRPVEYDTAALNGALGQLCNSIFSFTGNQMFTDPRTVDAQKATKANSDLLSVIELSDNIKRSADRLGGKSPK